MAQRTLGVSVIGHVQDNTPRAVDLLWPDDLRSFIPSEQKDVLLWAGARFAEGAPRKDANVVDVSALVLDYDGKHGAFTHDDILERWQGFDLVLHSTYTHTPEAPRYRVVLPLARPVSPAEYARVWAWAYSRDPRIDPACKNAARFFYWPTNRLDVEPVFTYVAGEPLDPLANSLTSAAIGSSGGPLRPLAAGAAATSGSPFARVGEVRQEEDFALVFKRCGFIQHAVNDAATLPYPEWVAALSIVARCENGDALAHAVSQPHAGYTPSETEAKYQWVKSSGPHTCATIRLLSPDACRGCTLPETLRLSSPIQLGVRPKDAEAHPGTPRRLVAPASPEDEKAEAFSALSEAKAGAQAARVAHDVAVKAQILTSRALSVARREKVGDVDLERAVQTDLDARAAVREARASLRRAEAVVDRLEAQRGVAGLPRGADPTVWARLRLTSADGVPKPADTLGNIHNILEHDSAWSPRFAFNAFSDTLYLNGAPLARDSQVTELVTELAEDYLLDTTTAKVRECFELVASRRAFHPVRDYLNALPAWDGENRLDSMLFQGFGVSEDDPYADVIRTISRRFLLSVVARVMSPGCQVDTVLVLQGGQGYGKSQALLALTPQESWFSRTKLNIGDKDAYMQLQGVWIYEIAEMHALRRADVDEAKAWLSQQSDKYRSPYARTVQAHPRQTVFVWTVNPEQYLADPTGNRRYWPVRCTGMLDREWIKANRDTLFAEAYARYVAGEKWWFDTGTEEAARLAEMTGDHEVRHPWHNIVAQYLVRTRPTTPFTVNDILLQALSKMAGDIRSQDADIVGRILADLGCDAKNTSVAGVKGRYYTMSAELLANAPGVREVKTNPFRAKGIDVTLDAK